MARVAVWPLLVFLLAVGAGCGGGHSEPPLGARLQQTLDRGGARRRASRAPPPPWSSTAE